MEEVQICAFSAVIDGATSRRIVALADGLPVGSIDVNDWHKPGGWVSSVIVVEEFRRQGIARRMLSRAMAEAMLAKKTGLGLSVKTDNEAARALYESLGFRVCYAFSDDTLAMTIHLE